MAFHRTPNPEPGSNRAATVPDTPCAVQHADQARAIEDIRALATAAITAARAGRSVALTDLCLDILGRLKGL
jgi:hypothetical protein